MKPLLSVAWLVVLLSCQSDPSRISHGFYADFFEEIVTNDFVGFYLANEKEYQITVENYYKQTGPINHLAKSNKEIKKINEKTEETIEAIKEKYLKKKGSIGYFEIDSIFIERNGFRHANYYTLPFGEYFDKKDSINIIKTLKTPMRVDSKQAKGSFFSFVFDSNQHHDFIISRIVFSKPYFYQNKALIFCNYKSAGIGGYQKVYLFENINGYWQKKASQKIGNY
ncbi:hypothetical protein [Emticicia agri]|uniref:Lipoprotein n=1 Tax=Emticicia agri TaxID=2492393 RepID=A0A4Q5LWY5_9BACT|nr:hypothetical protein [Emticicia agri]RYU94232.1 hypothetical protein EWM59_18210 [Emticicia agri]